MDLEVILAIIKNLFRIGNVSSITGPLKAKVEFDDLDDTVSYDLTILVRGCTTKDYWMPAIGEQVLCILLPTGVADGYIIGSIYGGGSIPPSDNPDERIVQFPNGTEIKYSSSGIDITTGQTVNIQSAGGDVVVNGVSLVTHTHSCAHCGSTSTPN